MIDLKGGAETRRGLPLFHRHATTATEAIALLTDVRDEMKTRQQLMADHRLRRLDVSPESGLRFHDLRHSYATWLVDYGVPPNMVQRVMGHERATTTLDLYTRRTDNGDRILRALDDPDDDDPGGVLAPG